MNCGKHLPSTVSPRSSSGSMMGPAACSSASARAVSGRRACWPSNKGARGCCAGTTRPMPLLLLLLLLLLLSPARTPYGALELSFWGIVWEPPWQVTHHERGSPTCLLEQAAETGKAGDKGRLRRERPQRTRGSTSKHASRWQQAAHLAQHSLMSQVKLLG
jgi:hypothetical protein